MQHWNSYWSSTKSLNSFAEGEHSQGYVGEVADFWENAFNTAPTPAKILDLATGNGALAIMAQDFNPYFEVFASDAASINPLSIYNASDSIYKKLEKIHFYSNMPSEKLTFADECFDLVISQFGFEYAESSAALQEINRVLKKSGKFIALVHHHDSFISRDCKVGLKIIESFQKVNGLLSQLESFGEFCQNIENKDQLNDEQQAEFKNKNAQLLQQFKHQQRECKSEGELDWYNLLAKELLPIIMDWRHTDSQRVNNICKNFAWFQLRLQDQQIAACSKYNIENIKNLTHKSWFSCECEALYLGKDILCWAFKAFK